MAEPTNEGWKEELEDWWDSVQDDCIAMNHTLHLSRKHRVEKLITSLLTEERAKAEERGEGECLR